MSDTTADPSGVDALRRVPIAGHGGPQPTDQQRSEAVTPLSYDQLRELHLAAVATIAELRAEVAFFKGAMPYRKQEQQIAALQARVAELEEAINRWYADDGEALANIAVELLRITPTTEK